MIFVDLRKGSGDLRKYAENVQLHSTIFGRLRVNLAHLRNSSDYHECPRSNLGYLC